MTSHMSSNKMNKRQPNIVLIVMDAARARSFSCYGYHRPTTPNFEKLAKRSAIYEQAISPAGWSLPAHASIFTGLYPSKHGAHDQHKYLSPEYLTMAEILSSVGYHTLSFCYNAYVSHATGLDRGFTEFNRFVHTTPRRFRKIAHKIDSFLALTRGLHDSGARYINKQVNMALRRLYQGPKPFFMFIHYEEPHSPFRPPHKFNRYLPNGVSQSMAKKINQDRWKYFVNPELMNERDFEILTALYDAEITYLDTKITEIFSWLEELAVLDETMVIITADHGENIGEHDMLGHAYCLYDTLLHVPLIIHYPRGMATPGRVRHQVQTLDLLPTIMAMLGEDTSYTYKTLQGYNLLSSNRHEFTIGEQSHPDLSTFYRRFPGADVSRFDRELRMIRTEQHKYIWDSRGDHELYDLKADVDEEHNIIAHHPTIVQDLDSKLNNWLSSFEPAAISDDVPEFSEEMKTRLRALGYLE